MKCWILCLCLFIGLSSVACGPNPEQQAKIDALTQMILEIKDELLDVKAKWQAGTLTPAEFKDASEGLLAQMKGAQEEKKDLEAQGISIWEQILWGAIGSLVRGLPSKGPLGMVVNRIVPWRKEA